MFKNVESNTGTVESRLKIKLSKQKGRPPGKSNEWKSPVKPTDEIKEKIMKTSNRSIENG